VKLDKKQEIDLKMFVIKLEFVKIILMINDEVFDYNGLELMKLEIYPVVKAICTIFGFLSFFPSPSPSPSIVFLLLL
jgi:hypothetical protein